VLALADVVPVEGVLVELLELPHAARARQLPSTDSAVSGRNRRMVVALERRDGCMGFICSLS
jgi:hypothetical protein